MSSIKPSGGTSHTLGIVNLQPPASLPPSTQQSGNAGSAARHPRVIYSSDRNLQRRLLETALRRAGLSQPQIDQIAGKPDGVHRQVAIINFIPALLARGFSAEQIFEIASNDVQSNVAALCKAFHRTLSPVELETWVRDVLGPFYNADVYRGKMDELNDKPWAEQQREILKKWLPKHAFKLHPDEDSLFARFQPELLGAGGFNAAYRVRSIVVKLEAGHVRWLTQYNAQFHGREPNYAPPQLHDMLIAGMEREREVLEELHRHFDKRIPPEHLTLATMPVPGRVLKMLISEGDPSRLTPTERPGISRFGQLEIDSNRLYPYEVTVRYQPDLEDLYRSFANNGIHLQIKSIYNRPDTVNPLTDAEYALAAELWIAGRSIGREFDDEIRALFIKVHSMNPNNTLNRLVELCEADPGLKAEVIEFLLAAVRFGNALDEVGDANVLFTNANGKWQGKIPDGMALRTWQMLEGLGEALTEINDGISPTHAHLDNIVGGSTHAYLVHSLLHCFGRPERLHIPGVPENMRWERLHALVKTIFLDNAAETTIPLLEHPTRKTIAELAGPASATSTDAAHWQPHNDRSEEIAYLLPGSDSFEVELARQLFNDATARHAVDAALVRLRSALVALHPDVSPETIDTMFFSDSTAYANVGVGTMTLDELREQGNLRMLTVAFLSGAFRWSKPFDLNKTLLSVLRTDDWETRLRNAGLNVERLRLVRQRLLPSGEKKNLMDGPLLAHPDSRQVLAELRASADGRSYRSSPDQLRLRWRLGDYARNGMPLHPLEYAHLLRNSNRPMVDADGNEYTFNPRKWDISPPGAEGPEFPLAWRAGGDQIVLDAESKWYSEVVGNRGASVVSGVSGSAARLFSAFLWLDVPNVTPAHFLRALFSTMRLPDGHSLYEVLRGAQLVDPHIFLGNDKLQLFGDGPNSLGASQELWDEVAAQVETNPAAAKVIAEARRPV